MATNTASSSRRLWQVPTFLLGAFALVAVAYDLPHVKLTPAQRYEKDFEALRQALDRNPVDAAQVQSLLHKVHGVEAPTHLAKQAPFVIGSALVIFAESTAAPDESAEQWKTARKLLEAAADNGIPEADKLRHRFRLAKARAHTGEEPKKVIDELNATLTCGDDVSEGNRVLAEMYLKLKPSNDKKARDAFKEYMAKMLPARTEAQQRQLNQARLRLGELQIHLNEPEEARKVLERIGPDSPAELLIEARILLAKSYLDEEEWVQAIRCLEQARDVRGISGAQKTYVLFHLAEAYLRAKKRTEAIDVLKQLRRGTGPEAQAAAFRLVELLIGDPAKRDEAVQVLEAVALELKAAETYDNKLLPLSEARDLFERVALTFRAENAFDLSIRVARAYAKIALPGRDHELTAEALQTWGELLLESVKGADPQDRPRLAEEGTRRLREAAREWHAVAAARKKPADRGDALCRAADVYLKAGDLEEALKMLDELALTVPDFPSDRLPDIWLKKGEIYLALGNRDQARLCYQNGAQGAKDQPSLTRVRCRLRLAEILLKNNDAKDLARVIDDLEDDLITPGLANDSNRDLQESALFFIADALFQQKEFRKTEGRLQSFLPKFPDSPRALNARFMLGQCYWNIAGLEAEKCKEHRKKSDDPMTPSDQRDAAEAQFKASYKLYMDWLKKAGEQFRMVEAALLKGMAKPKLAPAEAELLRKVSFHVADCAFYSGAYADCVVRYEAIADRYEGSVSQLEALKMAWRCYQYYLQDAKKASDTLINMRTLFLQMPNTEFDGTLEVRKREYWERWFEQVLPMKK